MSLERLLAPHVKRPHVVILGAGASRAACPNGDRHGQKLPLMKDLVSIVGIEAVLRQAGVSEPYDDFEAIYSGLTRDSHHADSVLQVEQVVFDYFAGLELPEHPTLYDHVVLSLRPKDLLVSFNWDPLLCQALVRNSRYAPMPTVHFLHGNVAIGYCMAHKPIEIGDRRFPCSRCGRPLQPSRLLYPVKLKDYMSHPVLSIAWRHVHAHMKDALVLTVFGYGAPDTDVEAISLLKKGWGRAEHRSMDETEIIDVRSEEDLSKAWSPFIYSNHYRVHGDFYRSIIARYPRRSCDAMFDMLVDIALHDERPIPCTANWPELREWYQPLLAEERTEAAS